MLLYLFSIKSAFTHGLHDRLMYGTATTLLPFKIPYKRRYIQHLPHVQPHLQHCARLTHCLVQHAATQHPRCPTQSVCSCDYGDHAPRNSLVQPLKHDARLTHCQVQHAATQHSRCPTQSVCSCDYGDHAPRNSLVQPLQHCARLTHCQVRHAATQHSRCPTRNV